MSKSLVQEYSVPRVQGAEQIGVKVGGVPCQVERSQMNKIKEHSSGNVSGLEGGRKSSKRHPVVNISRGKVTKTPKRKYQDIRAMVDINPGQRQSKLGSGDEYDPS